MSYITPAMARAAILKMKNFHDDVVDTYAKYDMDLLDNLGRRNIVMSQAQEKFFAKVLSSEYTDVCNDGKTGQPDIIIGELGKELECKLTSRHKSGAISFQSDYETLLKKGKLDYLYVVANQEFSEFAVFHFIGLTIDDFRPLASGSRGKVTMSKHKAMNKCNVLLGSADSLNEENLKKISKKLSQNPDNKEFTKLLKRIKYWQTTPTKYSIGLEEVSSHGA
tara:strand:+ start:1111 stop:1776 length:666 start_codon:yes stop_codon:yes gene_type:complete